MALPITIGQLVLESSTGQAKPMSKYTFYQDFTHNGFSPLPRQVLGVAFKGVLASQNKSKGSNIRYKPKVQSREEWERESRNLETML